MFLIEVNDTAGWSDCFVTRNDSEQRQEVRGKRGGGKDDGETGGVKKIIKMRNKEVSTSSVVETTSYTYEKIGCLCHEARSHCAHFSLLDHRV